MHKDFKLVQKRKIWFLIPACIVCLAIIAMIVYGLTLDAPLNLGMDFQGGYTVNVKLSTKLNNATYETYRKEVVDVIENLKDGNGNSYKLKVSSVQRQGSGNDASLYIKYKAVASDAVMEDEINPAIQQALQDNIFKIVPTISSNFAGESGKYTVDYQNFILVDTTFAQKQAAIETLAATHGVAVSNFALNESGKAIVFDANKNVDAFTAALGETAEIADKYSGQAVKGDIISATVSSELLTNALLAVALAIVLMLVYIAFRFEVSSGVAAIVALMHDVLMMFCFMAIFHVEINSTFIAALITILGYSINNTIIVFDRIRENSRSLYYKNASATQIANDSIRDTLMRSINTTITTLITIAMVALIGVSSIRIFAFPIIAGLLAGTFSSIFISPSIWAMWKDRKRKPADLAKNEKKSSGKAALA